MTRIRYRLLLWYCGPCEPDVENVDFKRWVVQLPGCDLYAELLRSR